MLATARPPWRSLAGLIFERSSASIPVDLLAVAAQFADIERADWPEESVDGITINCSDSRPQIFYRGDLNSFRTRFTVAHELGHAVISWHIGNAECSMPTPGFPRSATEKEADEFAAELLMPTDWLRHSIRENNADLDRVLIDIAAANTSATASMIALATVLPVGWALQLNNNEISLTHDFGGRASRGELDGLASASGHVRLHDHAIRWWRLFPIQAVPDLPSDKESAYGLFEQAYAVHGHPTRSVKSIDGSVSSILGSLGGLLHFDVAFAYLLWRVSQHGSSPLYQTSEFRRWLAWKAFQGTASLKLWQN